MQCMFLRREYPEPAPLSRLMLLLSDIKTITYKARNESTTARIYIAKADVPTTGLYYLFSACNGYLGIWKIKNGAIVTTPIMQMSSSYGGIHNRTTTGYYYKSGTYSSGTGTTNATAVYGATLSLVQFPSFTESEIDDILTSASYTRLDGINSDSYRRVSTSNTSYQFYYATSHRHSIWTYDGTTFVNFYKVVNDDVAFVGGATLSTNSDYMRGATIIGIDES